MGLKNWKLWLLLGLIFVGGWDQLWAQQRQAGFYTLAQFGLSTYKSKLVESNDTGTTLRYGFGSNAGSEGQLRFQLQVDTAATTFALNDSKLATTFQDTSIRYQWGYVSAGALFSRTDLKVTEAANETVDASGSGMGGLLGIGGNIGKNASLGLEITSVAVREMKNSLEAEVALPARLEIDIGAAVDLRKNILFSWGYRQRTMSISKDGASFAETFTTTYLGLRYSLFF